ncbi:helix-turn-helix transcriptional regulator [Hymenobacter terrenus]|uniref:helix-turn-helix transcriptional regulator n=1 Tax=Hymenobacter terrenus TaxID=1629124 RepID=UPI000619DD1C|nr:response regulator transcription factor [Hymenobacter terrenus]
MTLFSNLYLFCAAVTIINLVPVAVLLIVLRKAQNKKANLILSLLLLCLAGALLSDLLDHTYFFRQYPQLLGYEGLLLSAVGPLLYLYVLYHTRPDMRPLPAHLLHLLPVALHFTILWDFFTGDSTTKLVYVKQQDWGAIPHNEAARHLLKVLLLLYGIASYLLLRHRRVIRELASSVKDQQLQWLRNLLLIMIGLSVVWMGISLFKQAGYLIGFGMLFFSYWIAYHAVRQKYLFEPASMTAILPLIQEEPEVRYRTSTLKAEDMRGLMEQVTQHINETRPFLEPNLSLTSLAEQLQLTPNSLSQVLNEGFGESFYKFINRHRVQESQRLLRDPAFRHYSMLGIAHQAGFSAKSTFYKVFKEVVGCSPSEFISRNK